MKNLEARQREMWERNTAKRPNSNNPPAVPLPSRRSKLLRQVTGIHELIRDAEGNYDAGYKVDEGQHLRPYKRLLVEVTASLASFGRSFLPSDTSSYPDQRKPSPSGPSADGYTR